MSASVKISAENAWKAALDELEQQMTKATFNTWLKDTVFLKAERGTFFIGVRNSHAVDWLTNRLKDTIQRTLVAIDQTAVDIRFVVINGEASLPLAAVAAERPFYSRRDVDAHWHVVLKAYAQSQTSLQEKSCWQLLSKLEYLLTEDNKLQIFSSDPQALENLNRISNWLPQLEQLFHKAGLAVDLTLMPTEVQANGANGRTGKSKKRTQKAGGSGGDDEDPRIAYRNIRPPTDPLGSFVKTSHYAIRFWRPFLGADVFDLLQIISSYAYEFEVLKKDGPSIKTLARKMGRGDVYSIVGRGGSGEGDTHRKGKYGWLNELRDHQLCDHKQVGHGRGAKQYFDYLTKVSDLPLLTPHQVAMLSAEDQEEHEEWLRLHTGIDYDEWTSDTRHTRVPELPLREDP